MLPEVFTIKDVERYGENRRFTEGFTLRLHSECSDCMIVTALSRYFGTLPPTVSFALVDETDPERMLYQSHEYDVGLCEEWTRQQWRVPPMWHPTLYAVITVEIPEGTTLELGDFHNTYSSASKPWPGSGPRHNAHLGFLGAGPSNSRRALELAAQCGFSSCIVNIKQTRDGHLVCWHDPNINKLGTDSEGRRLAEQELDPINVADLTLEELRRYDLGVYRHPLFEGTRILLMEDAFRIMAKTGLHPMFSTHPAPSPEAWEQVKDMLQRYGLIKNFHVKSFKLPILEYAYSVFGDTIDGYTWDNGNVEELKKSTLYGASCRLGIELMKKNVTRERVREILDAGLFAAVFGLKERVPYREIVEMMEWGVTEFTEDHHCSMGLNW